MKPELSIVIPVFNRASVVERTLRSVEAQTLRPLKVILVDNDSTDGSMAVLRSWKDSVRRCDFEVEILEETKPGAAAARNRGLEHVSTPWVMFFDSDDTMRPDHCSVAMSHAANSNADVLGWSVSLVESGEKRSVKYFAGRDACFDNLMHGAFATQRWMARTDLVRKVGGWNAKARIWDDIELGARLLASGAVIETIPQHEPTVEVFPSDESISTQPWLKRLENMEVALLLMAPAIPPQRSCLLQYKRVVAAAEAIRTSGDPAVRTAAKGMFRRAVAATPGTMRRMLMHLVFRYLAIFSHGGVALISIFEKKV